MMPKSASDHLRDNLSNDEDGGKGTVETGQPSTKDGNAPMQDQLSHRNPDPMQDGADSDFPEPGGSPEHSFEGELKEKKP